MSYSVNTPKPCQSLSRISQDEKPTRETAARGRVLPVSQALVHTPISQNLGDDLLVVFPSDIRTKRIKPKAKCLTPPDRSGTEIQGFSSKSRRNLRHYADNPPQPYKSQFGLTYHLDYPSDGRECKRHLNLFLVHLRRLLPDIGYLWLLEFQRRNAPHFHIFLTIPPDREIQRELARIWIKIISGSPDCYVFHINPKNWIDWKMDSAGYLCKYLDKDQQKIVPEGYHSFGRFWGASSNMKPQPLFTIPTWALSAYDQTDNSTGETIPGETFIIRTLGRLADRKSNGYSRFRVQAQKSSYTMRGGTPAFLQLQKYLVKISKKRGGENHEI